jgi:hypothetical protein
MQALTEADTEGQEYPPFFFPIFRITSFSYFLEPCDSNAASGPYTRSSRTLLDTASFAGGRVQTSNKVIKAQLDCYMKRALQSVPQRP